MDSILGSCPNTNYSEANQIFSTLFTALVAATCNLTKQNVWPEDYGPKLITDSRTFDYIVVGSGSAGATIAGRLSENSNHNILLLEAGDDPPLYTLIPGMYMKVAFQKTKYDWEYYAEPSTTHSLEINNGVTFFPRAKMIGGCSSINGMMYVRGNRKDYDNWEADGNTGWGYDDVLKYFKKTENLQIKELLENNHEKYHGTNGEIKITEFKGDSEIDHIVNHALQELKYEFNEDGNAENNMGITKVQGNIDDGVRSSPATAFLKKKKNNLFIVKNALVSKVIINKFRKHTTGVEFINNKGKTISVKATKEVIISAGAINSPQLLMLSGIGPAKDLRQLKIPVIADLPVGLNLQDHFLMTFFVKTPFELSDPIKHDYTDSLYKYLLHRKGPLSEVFSETDQTMFINTSNATDKYPNVQILNYYYNKNDSRIRQYFESVGYSEDIIKSVEVENRESKMFFMLMFLLNPKSAGEVKLRSADPLMKPIIDLKYLERKEDVDVVVQTAKFVQQFINTSAMKQVGAKLIQPYIKRCNGLTFDEYWICYFRSVGRTGFHFSGSVKMGPIGDKTSVVSPTLKVHGIQGLRVADASIMPNIVSGNPNAATIMIGEKAADLIKADCI